MSKHASNLIINHHEGSSMSKKQDKPEIEDEGKTRDGAENGNGGGSIADRAEDPPVPTINPDPFGPGGTLPIPGTAGTKRKRVPVQNKVVLTQASCPGAGQLDPEGSFLFVVRADYDKAITKPKKDGQGRVTSIDYNQQCRPTWTEGLDQFLAANGLKLVPIDDEGTGVDPDSLIHIEEQRAANQDGALD